MKRLNGIREALKTVKHRKPGMIFCPRCCSPNIRLSSSLAVWLTPKQYLCEDCGYLGIVVMELEKDDTQKEENGT